MPEKERSSQDVVALVVSAFAIIKSNKQELINIIENVDRFFSILSKMKEEKMILKTDHEYIRRTLELPGIRSNITNAIHGDIMTLVAFIDKYQLVVDAENFGAFGDDKKDNLFLIYKNNHHGLIQKIEDKDNGGHRLRTIMLTNVSDVSLIDNENGIIKVTLSASVNDPHLYFQQLKKNNKGEYSVSPVIGGAEGIYFSIQSFDSDGIARVGRRRKYLGLIQKNITTNGDLEIEELLQPILIKGSETPFDEYGCAKAEIGSIGKVILRKKYLGGKCVGVDIWKKGWTGKETNIEKFDIKE